MSKFVEELNQKLFTEGEEAPIAGQYQLVDEDGNAQDFFPSLRIKAQEHFPEVPQEGLFYMLQER